MKIGPRTLAIVFLLLAVVLTPVLVKRVHSPASPADDVGPVPEEALDALNQGRYWHASRILRDYLAAVPDTSPGTLMLAAEAEAGWGGWDRVESLLSGRNWLDAYASGYGWSLLGRSRLALGRLAASHRALDRYLRVATSAGNGDRGIAELRRALALSEQGEVEEALAAFDRASDLLPQIDDWIQIFAADAAAGVPDTAEVTSRLAATDPELARRWGWRIDLRARTEARDSAGALRVARSVANDAPEASLRAEGWQRAGDLQLGMGETDAAKTSYKRAMEASPGSSAAVTAARQLSRLPGLSPDDQLRIGRLYLRHGNTRRGIEGLRAFLAADTGLPTQRAEVNLELGRAYFNGGHLAEAERHLLELTQSAPSARIGAEAQYLAGRAQYRSGRGQQAKATFLATADRFPDEVASAEALFLLADLEHDELRLEQARDYYERVIAIRPSIDKAGLAAMRLGGIAFAEGDYETATRVFERYRWAHPDGRRYLQATYWAGIAYLRTGHDALARQRFRDLRGLDPISYYGLRAAEHLGQDPATFSLAPSPPGSVDTDAEIARALERVDLLREIGKDDLVRYEVGRLREHYRDRDGALYALAEALNKRGETYTAIRIGWDIHAREGAWNRRLLKIIYPFPYQSIIMAEAAERGLDPYLVAGLIRQESMFHPSIASPAGAIGLMQIMPATGRDLAKQAGINSYDESLLEQPEVNLHLGTIYLAELIRRFGADRVVSALAAYNAGPHRVQRWRQFPEYSNEELFAERIPFAETRDYVKIVQQNARLYAALYDDSQSSPAEGSEGGP